MKINKINKGFTLIELLVVIGILAVLLAITLIAINPARQFSQANDTKRKSDVSAILNAVGQYAAEKAGALPPGSGINGGVTVLNSTNCSTTTPCALATTTAITPKIDICPSIVTSFIAQMPSDPKTGNPTGSVPTATCSTGVTSGTYNTGYTIAVGGDSRVTIAGTAEIAGVTISVTR